MRVKFALAFGVVALGTSAIAHQGVQNPAVKARMESMSAMGAETKVLGQMAKGIAPFDRERARSAALAIAKYAAETPLLFREQEDDPKSEAKPEIWETFGDFAAKSGTLEALALDLSESIDSRDDLGAAVASLGDACKACHGAYRE